MTKKLAVLKTYILWAWKEQNPLLNKSLCPNYVNHNLKYSNCPVCLYDTNHSVNKVCGACPMLNRWPSAVGDELLSVCGSMESAYPYYNRARRRDSKRASLYAGIIASALWKLYKELEDK